MSRNKDKMQALFDSVVEEGAVVMLVQANGKAKVIPAEAVWGGIEKVLAQDTADPVVVQCMQCVGSSSRNVSLLRMLVQSINLARGSGGNIECPAGAVRVPSQNAENGE